MCITCCIIIPRLILFYLSRWGFVFLVSLVVGLPVFILQFTPYPHTLHHGNSSRTSNDWPPIASNGPNLRSFILFLMATFVQVCCSYYSQSQFRWTFTFADCKWLSILQGGPPRSPTLLSWDGPPGCSRHLHCLRVLCCCDDHWHSLKWTGIQDLLWEYRTSTHVHILWPTSGAYSKGRGIFRSADQLFDKISSSLLIFPLLVEWISSHLMVLLICCNCQHIHRLREYWVHYNSKDKFHIFVYTGENNRCSLEIDVSSTQHSCSSSDGWQWPHKEVKCCQHLM